MHAADHGSLPMNEVVLNDGARIRVHDDTAADPWGPPPPAVLLIHGMCESSAAWFAWLPHLAREFRVIRADLRGLGESQVPYAGYPWSVEGFADDLAEVLDHLDVDRAHVVGAKLGGAIALSFAAAHPMRTTTVTALGPVIRTASPGGTDLGTFASRVASEGLRGWAASTMRQRLGSGVSDEQVAWWTELFCRTDERVTAEILTAVRGIDLTDRLSAITAPARIMVTESNPLHDVDEMRGWVDEITDGELVIVPGDGYHLAASQPDEVARSVRGFLRVHDPVD